MCENNTVYLLKGTEPGPLSLVSSGTILQLYHKPKKETAKGSYKKQKNNKTTNLGI